jgi:hypothetical protein
MAVDLFGEMVRRVFIGALPVRAINLLKSAPVRQLIAARGRKIR